MRGLIFCGLALISFASASQIRENAGFCCRRERNRADRSSERIAKPGCFQKVKSKQVTSAFLLKMRTENPDVPAWGKDPEVTVFTDRLWTLDSETQFWNK